MRPRRGLRPESSTSSVESSRDLRYQAIITTMEKQITMAMISSGIIGSRKKMQAKIVIQNGLVYQQTRMREIGARGAAILSSKKLIQPVNMRHQSGHLVVQGNYLNGWERAIQHQMIAANSEKTFLQRLKSATWKPSSEALRQQLVTPVPQKEKKNIAITATTLLSFFSGFFYSSDGMDGVASDLASSPVLIRASSLTDWPDSEPIFGSFS